jgi:hypothetical protein
MPRIKSIVATLHAPKAKQAKVRQEDRKGPRDGWQALDRLIDASAKNGKPSSEGFSRDQENSGTFAANASPARQHPLRNVL